MQKVKQVTYADVNKDTGAFENAEIMLSPIPIIRTPYTSKYYPKKMEVNNDPSLTVPDMSMSIEELVTRSAHGLPLDGAKVPLYEGDENVMPDLARLDLAERQSLLEETRDEIDAINKRIKERRQKAQQMNLDAIVKERVEAKLKEQAKNEPVKPV